MKLFHQERGKEVVYVQMQDIMHLNSTDIPIPASIYTQVFNEAIVVCDNNRFNFERFDKEHEVKFFRDLDFILDYDQYKDLTDEQLEEEGQKLADKANEIARRWNNMNESERQQNSNLLQEHENLGYMLNFLSEIYAIKHRKRSMPFPKFVKTSEKPKKKLSSKKKKWNENQSSAFCIALILYIRYFAKRKQEN